METLHTIDRQRQKELVGHAAILLQLNNIPAVGHNANEIIQQALSASVLVLDESTRQQIGLA